MYSLFSSVTRVVAFFLVVFLSTASASAAKKVDTSALRDDVTLEAIRDHQAAFQAIADANGGTRYADSPGFDDSADYVKDQLEAAGYDVTVQPFNFPYFEELSIAEFEQLVPNPTVYPYFDVAGFATMNYSGSGDVTAEVEGVDITIPPGATPETSTSGCEASDFLGFTPGRVALIQRGSCSFELKAINAEAAGASAVIFFNEGQPGRTSAFLGTLQNPVVTIPVIATSYAIGESLVSLSPGVIVRIDVETISELRSSSNVIADLPGHYDRVVLAGAHLDSVDEGPGINDNGSGAAALLEIALQMAPINPGPRNTVRFAWWGAEEVGLSGSDHYVSNLNIDEIKKLNAYLELEMLGSPNFVRFVFDGDGSDFTTTGPDGSGVIEQIINDYFSDQGLLTEPAPIDGRHSYVAFQREGVPFGGLFGGDFGIKTAEQAAIFGGTAGDQYDPCYHLACDTFDNVSLQALDEMSDAAAHAIQTLASGSTSTPGKGSGRLTCEDLGYDFSIKAEPDGCRQSSGFWKSNPGAWPVDSIEIGGVIYPKANAIDIMNAKAKGDKTYSLFIETVAAKLNDMTCGPYPDIAPVIADADAWLALNPPGSGIKSKDSEWDEGGALNAALSAFNGGSFMSGIWDLDGLASVEIETLDGIYFDWTSTRSVDAVIVKGGRNVNLYGYDPESFGDLGLHAPINSKNDTPYGLSYIEFCYDWDIDISVRKFNDQNDNGVWDDGEPEIGVDQFINPDGTIGGTDGWPYVFSFPMDTGFAELFWTPGTHQHSFAGTYTIQEQEFLLWDPTALYINGVAQPVSTRADIPYAGDADESVEVIFGNVGYTEILGRKFEDLNGNGTHDAGEPGVEDVTVTLTGTDILGDPVDLSTATGPGGEFAFLNLVPGTYTVTETNLPPGGWVPSTTTVSGPRVLDSGDSLDLEWVFGNLLRGSIHGYKFVDVNGNGVEDDGEPGLQGVTIVLTGDTDGDGDIDQVPLPTNDAGEYWFTELWPGEYNVAEIVPDGWIAVTTTDVDVTVVSGVELVARAGQAMLSPEQIAAGYEEVIDERLVFGNLDPGSIHGYKFDDLNSNGVDDGEPRVPGVTINLVGDVDGDGDADQVSDVTDANGEYGFTELYPGDFEVNEETPPGWIPTTPTSANVTVNSGEELVAIPGQAQLPPGSTKFEVVVGDLLAFGNFQLGSIHGFKFEDLDADGVWDPNEPRLQDWGFQLIDPDGNVIAETASDDTGEYWFLELPPGDYLVREVVAGGWTQSTENPPPIQIFSGQEYVAEDGLARLPPGSTKTEVLEQLLAFGNYQMGSIHGFKFEDLDADGIWDANEPPLENREFELIDAAGNLVDIAPTNVDGEFWFVELPPGGYSVREVLPDGWLPSTENLLQLFVQSGQEYVAIDGQANLPPDSTKYETLEPRLAFGNFQFGSIHGLKFEDLDADGVRDANEPPLENRAFELIDAAGNLVDIAPSNVDGEFWFVELPPGDYSVREVLPDGWFPSTENPLQLFVQSGQEYVAIDGQAHLPPDSTKYETLEPRLAFGNFQFGSIHGLKFEDLDADGVRDANEPPLENRAFELIDAAGNLVDIAPSNVDGEFWFVELPPGGYSVREVLPDGWLPSTENLLQLFVQSGQEYVAIDGQAHLPPDSTKYETLEPRLAFGNYRQAEVMGFKFEDLNANGIQDGGEPGVSGVIVTLDGVDGMGNAVNVATVTDGAGAFYFTGVVPGDYTVSETVPAAKVPSTPTSSGPHNLQSGQILDLGWVFGNYTTAAIDGFKFEDLNANGIQDGAEPGVPGVVVTLTGTDGQGNAVNVNTVTDAGGGFNYFGLTPGVYTVTEIVPAGRLASTPVSNGPHGLQSGQILSLDWVFGNFTPAQVTGAKFDDLNQNGVLDPGEPGVAGVIVTLTGTDGLGNAVNVATVTDVNGAFDFSGLAPGSYTVTETVPVGWAATTPVSSGPHTLQSGDSLILGPVFGNYLANQPPTATDDSYDATGNVGIDVPAASGLLSNDSDPDLGDVISIVATDTTLANGTVNVNAVTGAFTYTPDPGFTGNASFGYTVEDTGGLQDTATVALNVSDMIWFIDNTAGAGDGRLATPFNTLAAFEAVNGNGGANDPEADDDIFVYTGSGSYSGGVTLEDSQKLIGQGTTDASLAIALGITPALFSDPLPSINGTRPVLGPSGTAITLASGNTVRGLDVSVTGGNQGLVGSGFVTATINEIAITTETGTALSLNNGNATATFDSITSTTAGGNSAIALTNTGADAITVNGGTISDKTVDAVTLNTTAGPITLASMIIEDIGDMGGGFNTRSQDDAIHGQAVSGGLTLDGVTIRRISDMCINGALFSDGVSATTWTGLDIVDSTIEDCNRFHVANVADTQDEGGVRIAGLTGDVMIDNNTFLRTGEHLDLFTHSSGTLNLDVSNNFFIDAYQEYSSPFPSGVVSVGGFCVDVTVEGSSNANVTIGGAGDSNDFENCGIGSIRVSKDTAPAGSSNVDVIVDNNTFRVTDQTDATGTFGNTPQGGVLLRAGPGAVTTFDGIVSNNTFGIAIGPDDRIGSTGEEVGNADGEGGNVVLIFDSGVSQARVNNNTFNGSINAPWVNRADGNTSAAVLYQDNSYRGRDDYCCDSGFMFTVPGIPYRTQSRNGGDLDITFINDQMVHHDQFFFAGTETLEFLTRNDSGFPGGTMCMAFDGAAAGDGYEFKETSGTLELYQGAVNNAATGPCAPPHGTDCEAEMADDGVRGGASNHADTGGTPTIGLNPPHVDVDGANSISIIGTPCTLPTGGIF